jgi:hypothetical protein
LLSSTGGTPNNVIAHLGPFINRGPGDIALSDNHPLTVSGAVSSSNNLTLSINGALGLDANLSAGGAMILGSSGSITQTAGSITAGTLATSSQGGTHLMQPNNQIANLAVALNSGGGDIVIQDNRSLTVSGVFLNSTGRLVLQATGAVALRNSLFGATGGVEFGSTGFTQTGTAVFLPPTPLVVIDATGATLPQAVNPATARSMLASFHPGGANGNIELTTISAPSVLLAANRGHLNGTVNAINLAVLGQSGSAQLFGTIDHIAGPTAAQLVEKSGQLDNAYRFNSCAIGSVTCTVLPAIVPTKPALLNTISILPQQQQFNDPTINLLNVGSEDLF